MEIVKLFIDVFLKMLVIWGSGAFVLLAIHIIIAELLHDKQWFKKILMHLMGV